MFRNFAIVLPLLTLSLAIGCAKPEFKEFSPPGGGFRVEMPGTPKEQSQSVAGTQLKIFTTEFRDGAYIASYSDMPIPANEPAAQIENRLDGSRNGQLGNVGGQLISEAKIQLDGKYHGRDIRANVPSKQAISRSEIFLVGSRMYQLVAIGTQSFVDSPDSDRFFKSFALMVK